MHGKGHMFPVLLFRLDKHGLPNLSFPPSSGTQCQLYPHRLTFPQLRVLLPFLYPRSTPSGPCLKCHSSPSIACLECAVSGDYCVACRLQLTFVFCLGRCFLPCAVQSRPPVQQGASRPFDAKTTWAILWLREKASRDKPPGPSMILAAPEPHTHSELNLVLPNPQRTGQTSAHQQTS